LILVLEKTTKFEICVDSYKISLLNTGLKVCQAAQLSKKYHSIIF